MLKVFGILFILVAIFAPITSAFGFDFTVLGNAIDFEINHKWFIGFVGALLLLFA
jgi:hypothetical protein